jgi:hypothetical protein
MKEIEIKTEMDVTPKQLEIILNLLNMLKEKEAKHEKAK